MHLNKTNKGYVELKIAFVRNTIKNKLNVCYNDFKQNC